MRSVRPNTQKGFETKWSTSCDQKTETTSSTTTSLARLAGVWQAVIESFAPMGYEDENGFHYGESTEAD